MAFNLSERVACHKKYIRLLDPGAYEIRDERKCKENKAPFLSNTSRTVKYAKIWTDTFYDSRPQYHIPNPRSMMSQCQRFNFETTFKEDLEEFICRCGLLDSCECKVDNEKLKPADSTSACQAKIARRIYKGPPPHSIKCNEDIGTQEYDSKLNLFKPTKDTSRPYGGLEFFTDIYHGCRWSKYTPRKTEITHDHPGPTDYTIENTPTSEQICNEKRREYKRKTSKQLRFIEMVQRRNILEDRPGPGAYTPKIPKGYDLLRTGPKSERFTLQKLDVSPSPADHYIKRDFSPPEAPEQLCKAHLPQPSCFGIKAKRFKRRLDFGPSPASYTINLPSCRITHCFSGGFSSTAQRFVTKEENNQDLKEDEPREVIKVTIEPNLSSSFKSKTIRMKPLIKKINEPSPADLPQPRNVMTRSLRLQNIAPFFATQGRFRDWYNWIPLAGHADLPGPGYYELEKPICYSIRSHGPLIRSSRFAKSSSLTPAPNEYFVGGGIETILTTHNQKLKNNIKNTHRYPIKVIPEPQVLNFRERELQILDEAIADLDTDNKEIIKAQNLQQTDKSKLLRYFLYNHQIPECF